MKGLTHYLVAVAVATCFLPILPNTIEATFIIILGGVFGILPDTLDFRFARYVERHDYEVEPGPDTLDPKVIADSMAKAIDEAYLTQRTVKIKLHSMKMTADLWRRYSVIIDADHKRIIARIGPLVTTGQTPAPGTAPPEDKAVATSKFSANLLHTYDAETHIDIWHGNDYAFVPEGDHVRAEFIPWHRRWSHSMTAGLLCTPFGLLLFGLTQLGLIASVVILAGFWAHILTDQVGVMGSNLFYPFTRKRSKGIAIVHSATAFGNFATNYGAVFIMIWNINANAYEPSIQMDWPNYLANSITLSAAASYWLGFLNYFVYYILIPLMLIYIIVRLHERKHREPEHTTEEEAAEEALWEIEETITR